MSYVKTIQQDISMSYNELRENDPARYFTLQTKSRGNQMRSLLESKRQGAEKTETDSWHMFTRYECNHFFIFDRTIRIRTMYTKQCTFYCNCVKILTHFCNLRKVLMVNICCMHAQYNCSRCLKCVHTLPAENGSLCGSKRSLMT